MRGNFKEKKLRSTFHYRPRNLKEKMVKKIKFNFHKHLTTMDIFHIILVGINPTQRNHFIRHKSTN